MNFPEFTVRISGGPFGLSIDPGNTNPGSQLQLQPYSEKSALQRWSFHYDPATQGAILYNSKFNVFAAPDTSGKVVLYEFDTSIDFTGKAWQICGAKDAAIRIQNNENANMNASGGSNSGAPIITYEWTGDKSNMEWNAIPMATEATE